MQWGRQVPSALAGAFSLLTRPRLPAHYPHRQDSLGARPSSLPVAFRDIADPSNLPGVAATTRHPILSDQVEPLPSTCSLAPFTVQPDRPPQPGQLCVAYRCLAFCGALGLSLPPLSLCPTPPGTKSSNVLSHIRDVSRSAIKPAMTVIISIVLLKRHHHV